MNNEEIRELIKKELNDIIQQGNLPIKIYNDKPKQTDIDKSVEYSFVKRLKVYLVFLVKKAGKAVSVAVFLVGLYETMFLSAEFLFPNTLPSAQQLVRDARGGILHVAENIQQKREETEHFVIIRDSWFTAPNNSEYAFRVTNDSKGVNGIIGANDIHMFPASGYTGISGNYIASGGNV